MGNAFLWLGFVAGIINTFLIGAFGFTIMVLMFKGRIDLSKLLSEDNGVASLSRFQFLIFTFVISMSLFLLVLANIDSGNNAFPELSTQALLLLGISGGTYAVSKGIQKNAEVEKNKTDKGAGGAHAVPPPPPPPPPPG